MNFKRSLFLAFLCFSWIGVASTPPQYGLSGLSVFVDAGLLVPNAKQANFYDGRGGRPNTISRVLYSQSYGQQIWSSLKNQGYLQSIGSYNEITIADYPEMYYRLTYQIGLGIRYDYSHGWGWLLRFDYSQLTATGVFHLNNAVSSGILTNQGSYINCNMVGVERRLYIDVALTKRFVLGGNFEFETQFGFNFNNTKVTEQQMQIGGTNYSILDVWNGANDLYAGIGSYDYINQGGLGFGALGGLALCYVLPSIGSIDLGYTMYYTKTTYKGYNEDDAFAMQHVIYLKINLSNFSFFQ
ncbi:MAG: hypothetical protein IJ764_02810 [Bacteroidales bacterium]|nr:hypothetical protein [Bacteroidales bacterium]